MTNLLPVVEWSNKLLDFLLSYRQQHPETRFWLRQRDRGERLSNGYWFQGNENYIFVSFWNRSGGSNRTRSIGFVVRPLDELRGESGFEIAYNEEKDRELIDKVYKQIIMKFNMEELHETKFRYLFDGSDVIPNLQRFLTEVKPTIDRIIRDAGREDMFINENDFKETLERVLTIRQGLGQQPEKQGLAHWIELYKKLISGQIAEVDYNELYKWETVQHFQNNWTDNHSKDNILEVVKRSFYKDGNNLWSGLGYFPYAMLLGFAEKYPARLSAMFRDLFNEELPLKSRFDKFQTEAASLTEKMFPGEDKAHYQDDRALTVYLNLRYPGKYYLYKSKMFKKFCELTGFWVAPKTKKKDTFPKVEEYLKMCDALNKVLTADAELMEVHRKRLPSSTNIKDNEHLLTQDFVYAVSNYLHPGENEEAEFLKVIALHESDKLRYYFGFLDALLGHLEISEPDERITFSCKSQQLSFIVGHRYGLVLFKDKADARFGVMSPKVIDATTTPFEGLPEAFYSRLQTSDVENYMPDIQKACSIELDKTEKSRDLSNNNRFFEKAAFDKVYRDRILHRSSMLTSTGNLNQILFGPPGTGKTYHTINEAVRIVDPEFYKVNEKNRDNLRKRFQELLIKDWDNTTGRIAFCTFHQSFSYEDFVEGIKPVKPKETDMYLRYAVEDGIFKRLCRLSIDNSISKQLRKSRIVTLSEDAFRKAQFYKISLGDANDPDDNEIYEYCVKNNCIALGWGEMNDFSGLDESGITAKCKDLKLNTFAAQALNYFIHYMKVGNYVMVSNGNRYVRAIGRVTGEYKYDPSGAIRYNHFRGVEWLVVSENIPVSDLYSRNFSQMSLYKLDEQGIRKEFFVGGGNAPKPADLPSYEKYVLVIDEINRGNVASIFGELITLIEKDKRAGGSEELQVILPYSKETFKVPSNVYIVGTMNTADRSIEALDTALRRRFSFREMPSRPELIREQGRLNPTGKIGSLDVVRMLEKINERIGKLIDKDHKIGHSYFMEVENEEGLKAAFHTKVIPLLEEYFFGDFGKIGLVLGNSFIERDNGDGLVFAKFDGYEDGSIVDDFRSRPVFRITQDSKWNFTSIYE